MLNDIFLAFIPMFFAMDALGVLAVFPGLTQGLSSAEKLHIIVQSLWTATALAIGFIFLGKSILSFLGIGLGDFMIAGGSILFCLAMVDLLNNTAPARRHRSLDLGVVPFGTPLIVGPAVLTMALMLMNQFGWVITLVAVLLNIVIVGLVLLYADKLVSLIGSGGSRALSKIMYLLLAAIGVMMVRKGVVEIVTALH
ncbi:MAG: MarC family protein [Candidatus Omnitrophica bacterium]|nr:MarC family protein [Candidatus Omnitrophota bacterium]